MRAAARRWIVLLGVGLLVGAAFAARLPAATYTFTRIADTAGGVYTSFGDGPSISNSGAIAFQAGIASGAGIFRAEPGGGFTTIADTTDGFNGFGVRPSIDRLGDAVAFDATTTSGAGAYRGSGGPLATIAAPPIFSAFVGSPVIQPGGSGQVVFVAFTTADGAGIYRGDGTAPATLVAGAAHGLSEFGNNPGVNALGNLLFRADLDGVGSGVFIRSGATTTPLALVGPTYSGFAGSMALNDSGVAAFRATYAGGSSQAILTGVAGGVSVFADTTGAYLSFNVPSIDSRGRIIVRAALDAGGAILVRGPDPRVDSIIGVGDAVDGSTVIDVTAHTGALNDSGQAVFRATLADGRAGIYRADPAPCPADIVGASHRVDVNDLLAVITTWGPCAGCPPHCPADIAPIGPPQGDCQIDVNDLLAVITTWGPCP